MATPKYNVQLVLKKADGSDPNKWEWKFKFPFFDVRFPRFSIDLHQSIDWQLAIHIFHGPDQPYIDLNHIQSMCQMVCDCDSIQIVFPKGMFEVAKDRIGQLVEIISNFSRIFCAVNSDDFIVQTEREILPRTSVELLLG